MTDPTFRRRRRATRLAALPGSSTGMLTNKARFGLRAMCAAGDIGLNGQLNANF